MEGLKPTADSEMPNFIVDTPFIRGVLLERPLGEVTFAHYGTHVADLPDLEDIVQMLGGRYIIKNTALL